MKADLKELGVWSAKLKGEVAKVQKTQKRQGEETPSDSNPKYEGLSIFT